jgi:hypothetical protein
VVLACVLAVHSHHQRQAGGEVAELVERVTHPGALAQLDGDLPCPRALAQHREQHHRDLHARDATRAAGVDSRR